MMLVFIGDVILQPLKSRPKLVAHHILKAELTHTIIAFIHLWNSVDYSMLAMWLQWNRLRNYLMGSHLKLPIYKRFLITDVQLTLSIGWFYSNWSNQEASNGLKNTMYQRHVWTCFNSLSQFQSFSQIALQFLADSEKLLEERGFLYVIQFKYSILLFGSGKGFSGIDNAFL